MLNSFAAHCHFLFSFQMMIFNIRIHNEEFVNNGKIEKNSAFPVFMLKIITVIRCRAF